MNRPPLLVFVFITALVIAGQAAGPARTAAPLRLSDAVVGSVMTHTVTAGDSIATIAARLGVDATTLARQNHIAAAGVPLRPGHVLSVDNRHVVPGGVNGTVVINIAQRMLFLFSAGGDVRVYPVGMEGPIWPVDEVIYEPVLMAQVGDRVFLEVHPDVDEKRNDPLRTIQKIAVECPIPDLDWSEVERVVQAQEGVARDVTRVSADRSISSR